MKRIHTEETVWRAREETGRSARGIFAHHLVRERPDETLLGSSVDSGRAGSGRTILRRSDRASRP